MTLNPDSASFSWNYSAEHDSGFRDTFCKGSDGKYHAQLSQIEATCYWQNYPAAGKAMVNAGMTLNQDSASFDWNYNADRGTLRSVVCDKMKKCGDGTKVSSKTKVDSKGVPEKGCTSSDSGDVKCNWT